MDGEKLFIREYGKNHPQTLIILHGLFGMSDNWVAIGKYFSKQYHVIIPDLRNHGNSPHTDDFSYELMMEDILHLMDEKGVSKAIFLGHSMGGKLVMNLAFHAPNRISKIVVADMSMREGEFREIHAAILDTIAKTDLQKFETYAQLEQYFGDLLPQRKIVLFALKNIKKNSSNNFEWKLNYLALYQNTHKIMEEVVPDEDFIRPTLFIRGGLSDYVTDIDFDEMKMCFPNAILKTIPKASHWVHADNTPLFLKYVSEFLEGEN